MAANLKKFRQWLLWLLPHGLHVARGRQLIRAAATPEWVSREALSQNTGLHNLHAGQRCFILGNGPSSKAINLAKLAGQVVISVSNGYLHKDYGVMAPRYHCVPQMTYGLMTPADVVAWFREMHERIGDAELFLNETEAELVREHGLFKGRKVHFVAMRKNFDEMMVRRIVDIAEPMPGVQSVPVMAITIAMYMGFNEVVLLGIDHDHFKDGKYVYAFDLGVQKDKDHSVASDGQVRHSWHDDFQSLARLWRQYRVLGEIARENGVRIVNSTPGGELDEFERVPFRTYFPESVL